MQRPSGQGFAFEDGATRLLPNVRPGDRAVVLHTAAGSIVERRRVEVLPGQQAEVTFDLAGWIRVNGRVTRDGGRIGDDAYVLSLVSVGEGGGWPSQDLVVSRGQYTQLLRPGTWDVHRDGIPTGERLVITDRPFEQQHDIDLLVTSLGVVILAPTGERLGGNMTLTWRERLGREGANFSRGVTSPRFFLDDIVPGWISAVYTAPDGTVYTADPTQVMRGEENILTLLPP
jgi:hypothetical protein